MTGRIVVFTGDGKGKTTAALGMAVRTAGHGGRVLMIQFIKGDSNTGELVCIDSLDNIEIRQAGRGFLSKRNGHTMPEHAEAAAKGLEMARDAMASGLYALVILDEIHIAVSKGLLPESVLLDALEARAPGTHVVLTGRNAPNALLDLADTVTEMRCAKHAFQKGVPATRGVEF